MAQRAADRVVTPKSSENVGPAPSSPSGLPWYKASGNILLAVAFLPPVGAILAWLFARWPTVAKVFATLWAVLVTLILTAALLSVLPNSPFRVGGQPG